MTDMAMQKPSARTLAHKRKSSTTKYYVVAGMILLSFLASYRIAQAGSTAGSTNGLAGYAQTAVNRLGSSASGGAGGCCGGGSGAGSTGSASGSGAAASGGGCCGGGANAPASAKAPKTAALQGGIQKISVDLSKGYYNPSNIVLKAGVPTEITFSQGSGCTGVVSSQQLNFSVDVSGGPQTVKLPALQAGTYQFYCGMQMVYGSITVK